MILNEGLNAVRDLVDAGIEKGQAGTGTTAATPTDTGLETAVVATLLDVTSTTKTDKMITVNYDIDANTGNSSNLSEMEIRFTSGDSFNRVVHTPISKDDTIEVSYITSFLFQRA